MFGSWKKWAEEAGAYEARRQRPRWGYRRPKYNVPVNIVEYEDRFEAWVYALSFPKAGIKVSVVDDMLYITGKRTPEGDPSPNFFLQEYPIKSFERSFELSERVDKAAIQARYEEGILKVIVPKTLAEQTPEMEIEVE